MTRKLTQRELCSKSGEVMRRLDDGEDFVITRDGKAVGELRSIQPRKRKFLRKEELLVLLEGTPPLGYERFRADIDAFVDQDPTPRC